MHPNMDMCIFCYHLYIESFVGDVGNMMKFQTSKTLVGRIYDHERHHVAQNRITQLRNATAGAELI